MTARRAPPFLAAVRNSPADPPTAAALTNTAVASATAAAKVSGIVQSKRTASAPGGTRAAAGSRVRARTASPSAASPATRLRPTLPVAPVTTIITAPCHRCGLTPRDVAPGKNVTGRGGGHIGSPRSVLDGGSPCDHEKAGHEHEQRPDHRSGRRPQVIGGTEALAGIDLTAE